MFALADKLYADGDKAGAAEILAALTQDKHPELRAEARFRLAAVREAMGDLSGATAALRDLLAEQPEANRARLELARFLEAMGDSERLGSNSTERARSACRPRSRPTSGVTPAGSRNRAIAL